MNDETQYAQKKILVAEDQKDLREALYIVLMSEGFEVLTATDGVEAIDIAFKEIGRAHV